MRRIYPLNGPANYSYTTPIFDKLFGLADPTDTQWNKARYALVHFCTELIPTFLLWICCFQFYPLSANSDGEYRFKGWYTSSVIPSNQLETPNRELSPDELRQRRLRQDNSMEALLREMFYDSSDEGDKTLTESTPDNVKDIWHVPQFYIIFRENFPTIYLNSI
jgi:hypothetical protein